MSWTSIIQQSDRIRMGMLTIEQSNHAMQEAINKWRRCSIQKKLTREA